MQLGMYSYNVDHKILLVLDTTVVW